MPPDTDGEFRLSPLAPWAPAALTILGWWVVNWQANRREIRKEQRSIADAAKKLTVSCADEAIGYHCTKGRDESTEGQIKSQLELIEIELARIPEYREDKELVRAMAAFADACTGGEFESSSKGQLSRSDPLLVRISSERNFLLVRIEESFSRRFTSQ